MILVSGGTGFIWSELIRQLDSNGLPFRLLLHPSKVEPKLPTGVNMDIALSSFGDERGIKAALQGVDVIYHISAVEQSSSEIDLQETELQEIAALTKAAGRDANKRIIYLSHLGASRSSAFNLMKAKGIAESMIIASGLDYTIMRSSMVYGAGDVFTQKLARLIKLSPGITLVPGDGSVLLQPIWLGDLVTCLVWALDLESAHNSTIEIGGPEHISFLSIMEQIAAKIRKKTNFVEYNPARLNSLTRVLSTLVKNFPTSVFWMDYLAENRVCQLDSIPRLFGINPARFHQKIDYLKTK